MIIVENDIIYNIANDDFDEMRLSDPSKYHDLAQVFEDATDEIYEILEEEFPERPRTEREVYIHMRLGMSKPNTSMHKAAFNLIKAVWENEIKANLDIDQHKVTKYTLAELPEHMHEFDNTGYNLDDDTYISCSGCHLADMMYLAQLDQLWIAAGEITSGETITPDNDIVPTHAGTPTLN